MLDRLIALPVLVPALLLLLLVLAALYWHPAAPGQRRPAPEPEPELEEEFPDTAAGPAEEPIQDSQAVIASDIVLVWRHGVRETEFAVTVDRVSCDHLAFEGLAHRAGEAETERRLFHTLDLPHECLVSARTPAGQPIGDMRAWLASLRPVP